MLSITILTLLIASNVISRIQAEEQEERKAQFNGTQTFVYKSDSVIEALKIQKRNTLDIVPKSYVDQTNHIAKSQSGNRLRRDLPNLNKIFDAPLNRTGPVNYFGSRTYQSNNVYGANYGKKVVYGSQDVQIRNTFSDNPNGTNVYGPILVQENNTYQGENKNAQYGASITQIDNNYSKHPGKNDINTGVVVQNGNTYSVNPENKTLVAIITNQLNNTFPKAIENNKDALKPVIHQSGNSYSSSNYSEAGINTKNNTESQVDSAKQDATDPQGNSSSTYYDPSSHIENLIFNKERETYANKHIVFNGQMSLSYNIFYSLLYSLIILFKYSLSES